MNSDPFIITVLQQQNICDYDEYVALSKPEDVVSVGAWSQKLGMIYAGQFMFPDFSVEDAYFSFILHIIDFHNKSVNINQPRTSIDGIVQPCCGGGKEL